MGIMKEIDIEMENNFSAIKTLYDAFNRKYPGFCTFEEYLERIKSRNKKLN